MNLTIDIGNSLIKYGVFEQGQLAEQGAVQNADQLLEEVGPRQVRHAIVASVARQAPGLVERLPVSGKVLELNHATALPIENLYRTPQTLGADRLAGVVGAAHLFSGQNCLVIDAGTCLTYDFIDKDQRYHGGSISPGIDMKFKALHTFTGRLPLTQRTEESVLTGQTTQEALQSGVLFGTLAEVQGIIALYQQRFPSLTVVLCGGDASFFDRKVKATIFVIPELVLIGLHRILEHNV